MVLWGRQFAADDALAPQVERTLGGTCVLGRMRSLEILEV